MWVLLRVGVKGHWLAALGLLLACSSAAPAAPADVDVGPYLPRCGRTAETRVPIPSWDGERLARLRQLIVKVPPGGAGLVYGELGPSEDDVAVEEAGKAYSATVRFTGAGADAGEVKLSALDQAQPQDGAYHFVGFFDVTRAPAPTGAIALRRHDTFDVVSSGRYCLGGDEAAALAPAPPPAAQTGSLPQCRRTNERRVPIATWKPKLTQKGDLRMAPPTGNGRIVSITIDPPKDDCSADPDKLYSFSLPEDPRASDSGGLAVNLRGNRVSIGSGCRLDGFFMNEPVFGIHQGWTETYFGAIDRARVVASGHYCLAR
jgi:hypothetical protein